MDVERACISNQSIIGKVNDKAGCDMVSNRLPYCMSPFLHLAVFADGRHSICCSTSFCVTSNSDEKDRERYWNGADKQNLRYAMFHWEYLPEHCKICNVHGRYSFLNKYVEYLLDNGVNPEDIQIPENYYPTKYDIGNDVLWGRIKTSRYIDG